MASTTGSVITTSTETKRDEVIESHPPSHILQDGRFIWLPDPSAAEKTQFLERSIARHKLLTEDLRPSEEKDESTKKGEKDGKGKKKDDAAEPKIHPLAVASARVQTNGINELSKAINLNGLVNTDEFFGLTNIVNPLLGEATTTSTSDKQTAEKAKGQEQEQRLRARYLGKRKRAQFVSAAATLDRHQRRLAASVAAQQGVDRRLQQLRPLWRLVAPEHGTRAKAHPVNPIETVAIDVDVYDRDRTGGGVVGQQQKQQTVARHGIARRVPRYAVIELPEKEKVDVDGWKTKHDPDRMEMDNDELQVVKKTKAEPFTVADPTLGKIDVDFDPSKVPMLTLQLEIGKGSTGFLQFACLEPSALGAHGRERQDDEQVVVALQHSLFCASLFESIRTELAPAQKVWLSSDMEVNFLPPPTYMAGSEGKGALSMIHCHEGEVKVQLDCEYSLAVKLVEAQKEKGEKDQPRVTSNKDSGSQTPAQLHALCRALLLHAQTVYHEHSLRRKDAQTQTAKEKKAKFDGHLRKQTTAVDELPPAHILQSCVGLGAKMLLERKVRRALSRVQQWCASDMGFSIEVEWLPLPLFELASHLVISCQEAEGLAVDVTIERDELMVTSFTDDGIYQKVQFHSANELEIFLKMALKRRAPRTSSLQAKSS